MNPQNGFNLSDYNGLEIVGDPIHDSTEALLDLYTESEVEYLRQEMSRSVGDYVLVDGRGSSTKLITSPMFTGGYVHTVENTTYADNLGAILRNASTESIQLDPDRLHHYLSGEGASLPYSTVFSDIVKVQSGMRMTVDADNHKLWSYFDEVDLTSHEDFESVGRRLAQAFSEHYSNVSILFSGGIDSGLLYAFLAETTDANPNLLTFDWPGPSNNKKQAKSLAAELGEELSIVDFSHGLDTEREAVLSSQEKNMKTDLVNINSPYFGITPEDIPRDGVVLSGQNFGEISALHMKQQQFKLHYRLQNQSDFGGLSEIFLDEAKRLARNVLFTDVYRRNSSLRKFLIWVLKRYFSERRSSDKQEAIPAGFISSSFPNFFRSFSEKSALNELDRIETANLPIDSFLVHYIYAVFSNANRAVKVDKSDSSSPILLPGSSGPAISYMLGRGQTLGDAYFPKREYYKTFESLTAVDYHEVDWDLSFENNSDARLQGGGKSALLSRNKELLADPLAFEFLSTDVGHDELEERYSISEDMIGQKIRDVNKLGKAYRVLNVEALLQKNIFG